MLAFRSARATVPSILGARAAADATLNGWIRSSMKYGLIANLVDEFCCLAQQSSDRLLGPFAEERLDLYRGEALLQRLAGLIKEFIGLRRLNQQDGPHTITHATAEQIPDRRLQSFALNVPEGLVEGAQS